MIRKMRLFAISMIVMLVGGFLLVMGMIYDKARTEVDAAAEGAPHAVKAMHASIACAHYAETLSVVGEYDPDTIQLTPRHAHWVSRIDGRHYAITVDRCTGAVLGKQEMTRE